MGIKETAGYCGHCQKDILVRAQTPNHLLYLVLSIITSGFWLIVWVIICLRSSKWICSQCGRPINQSSYGSGGIVGSHVKGIKICMKCGKIEFT